MTQLPDFAIEAKKLEKIYGKQGKGEPKHALKGIDLEIPRGSIFGLLGPNGAGKSTFINILAGMVIKTGGNAKIWGIDIEQDPRNARAAIGIVPQEISLDAFFSPREILGVQAGLYGVPKNERRSDELLDLVGLMDKADAYSRSLSGGMKRRLMVAKAMVHNPPVLILDEPTAGVDVELRQGLWKSVRELNDRGVTILLTTHYLEEAEELCDQIAIINHGEIVKNSKKSDLMKHLDQKEVILTFDNSVSSVPKDLSIYNAEIITENQIKLTYHSQKTSIQDILSRVTAANLNISDISTRESDLEDVFINITQSGKA
jgi:ABC-2 type transport system ATP-binding protein